MKISQKMYISLGTLISVFLITTFFLVVGINNITKNTEDLLVHPYSVRNASLLLNVDILKIQRFMKDIILSDSEDKIVLLEKKINFYEKDIFENLNLIKERFLGDPLDVVELENLFKDSKPIREKVISFKKQGNLEGAYSVATEEGEEQLEKIESSIKIITSFAEEKADFLYKDSLDKNKALIGNLYLLLFITILVIISISVLIIKSILKPLKKLSEDVKKIGEGNLNHSVDENTKDEIGELGHSFNEMTLKLKKVHDTLEDKVKERTLEFENKNLELEKMNKVMVGRELKMVELKSQIKNK